MQSDKLRRQIAFEAARLMYIREEAEFHRAKQKAAQRLGSGGVRPSDLPSNAEIRDEIQALARLYEGPRQYDHLREMRLEALRLMRILICFRPRLIGGVLSGQVRAGSDIALQLFADNAAEVTATVEDEGMVCEVQRRRSLKQGVERLFTQVRIADRFPVALTVFPASKAQVQFKSSITGKRMERATISELEQLLAREYPDLDLQSAVALLEHKVDRFQVYQTLLLPLENVRQDPRYHPEGDALYHSLQVFERARDQLPYDEEFLLAALLHDVGKAIDPLDHVAAGLEALDGFITDRTRWLIEHHLQAQQVIDGGIGARAHRRLKESPDYDELLLLVRCDRAGRRRGAAVPEVEEALAYLREMAQTFGG